MRQVRAEAKYDLMVRVRLSQEMVQPYTAQLLDWGGRWDVVARRLVTAALTRGLTDRARLVVPLSPSAPTWACDEVPPVACVEGGDGTDQAALVPLVLGVLLDPVQARRLMDLGPDAEDADASAAFRNFWGPRSEMRRFQDSSIREAVVWECDEAERTQVVKWIALYVLQRHCRLQPSSVLVQPAWLSPALTLPGATADDTELRCHRMLVTFEQLAMRIRNVPLPLGVMAVQGVDPAFRYASTFGPSWERGRAAADGGSSGVIAPSTLRVMVRLEASGKWPSDLDAISHIKTAFYIRLAKGLDGKENMAARVAHDGLRVALKGFVFVLELYVEMELHLRTQLNQRLETSRHASADPEAVLAELAESKDTLAELQHRYTVLPLVTGMLHSVHTATPSFSGAVRLAKRWVGWMRWGRREKGRGAKVSGSEGGFEWTFLRLSKTLVFFSAFDSVLRTSSRRT
jgi:U3 small nucleolar RNA-associated protein 22